MGMTPHDYFVAFVRGNYEDFLVDSSSVRRALNAAVSASHLADHYYNYHKRHSPPKVRSFDHLGKFLEYLSLETNECFRDIRSISNAYKHLYTGIDPKQAANSSISSAGSIESISFSGDGSDISSIEEEYPKIGDENKTATRVVFTRKDGKRRYFLPTLKIVYEFWNKLFKFPSD